MNLFILISLSLIATISTFEISKLKSFSSTRASALITIVMVIFLRCINYFYNIEPQLNDFDTLIFSASFAGMCSFEKYSLKDMSVIAVALAIFFFIIRPHDHGLGGSLGASAFICCTLYFYLKRVILYRLTP